jgi:hypothetical protein
MKTSEDRGERNLEGIPAYPKIYFQGLRYENQGQISKIRDKPLS